MIPAPTTTPVAIGLCMVLAGAGAGTVAAQVRPPPADPGTVRMVEVDGSIVRVQALGLEERAPGQPVVVFEAGSTNPLEVWTHVLPEIAGSAPVIAYDRAGLGQSEWDGVPPTPRHVAQRLRLLLDEVGAEPPWVLVGYSWGGVLVRFFAGLHPADVAGIVYVDPGPIVTQSLDANLAPFEAIGAGREGYDALYDQMAAVYKTLPPAMRAEFEVFRTLMDAEPAERGLLPVPEVPVAVVLAGKHLPLPLHLPYDARAHHEADLRHRIRMLSEWALESPRGVLLVTNASTHGILGPGEEPDLVVWAIQRVLAAAGEAR